MPTILVYYPDKTYKDNFISENSDSLKHVNVIWVKTIYDAKVEVLPV